MNNRFLLVAATALLILGEVAVAGPRARAGRMGDGGPYINFVLREARMSPVRAHVGDPVTLEMVFEDKSDSYNDTIEAQFRANNRVVARKNIRVVTTGAGDRLMKVSVTWDTGKAKPGEYKVRGEISVWGDSSEFENHLDFPDPLVLAAPGGAFPGGAEKGGVSETYDTRWKQRILKEGGPAKEVGGGR